jgi:hypothetical protein
MTMNETMTKAKATFLPPPSPKPSRISRMHTYTTALVLLLLALSHWSNARWIPDAHAPRARNVTLPDLYEAGIPELQAGMTAGHFSAVDLVKAYFARIDEVNYQRASLRAVIEVNPRALLEAQLLDEERAFFGARGSLHGIPVLAKDNIATIYAEGRSVYTYHTVSTF